MRLDKVPQSDYVEEQHGPVYSFLSSYKTYFTKLMGLNIIFIVFNIPMMFVAFAFSLVFLPMINDVFTPDKFASYMNELGLIGNTVMDNNVGTDAAYQLYYLIIVFTVMFFLGSTLLCIGPFQAGFSQIYRNMYRQSGLFFFSDFKDGMKTNLKQSVISMIISMGVTALILTAIGFYSGFEGDSAKMGTAISTFFIVLFFIFVMVQNMVWQMIVSVDLPLRKIYKNAMLFVLLKPGQTFGLLLVTVIMLLGIPFVLLFAATYVANAIVIFYYLMFALSFVQYMNAYATGEYIKQYIGGVSEPSDEDDDGSGEYSPDDNNDDDGTNMTEGQESDT